MTRAAIPDPVDTVRVGMIQADMILVECLEIINNVPDQTHRRPSSSLPHPDGSLAGGVAGSDPNRSPVAGGYIERTRNFPLHLGRLRYFGNEEAWSYAFYKYSDEKYELCVFGNGGFYGTPEGAFDTGSVYLEDR